MHQQNCATTHRHIIWSTLSTPPHSLQLIEPDQLRFLSCSADCNLSLHTCHRFFLFIFSARFAFQMLVIHLFNHSWKSNSLYNDIVVNSPNFSKTQLTVPTSSFKTTPSTSCVKVSHSNSSVTPNLLLQERLTPPGATPSRPSNLVDYKFQRFQGKRSSKGNFHTKSFQNLVFFPFPTI